MIALHRQDNICTVALWTDLCLLCKMSSQSDLLYPALALLIGIAGAAVAYFLVSSNSKSPKALQVLKAPLTSTSEARPVLKPDAFQTFTLTEKTNTSHNVAIYRFALPKPNDILGLPIGQHMSLAATMTASGKDQPSEVVRSYTPISSDEDHGHFDLMIKSYPQGNISKHMGGLSVGDTMKVKGPKGAMVYTPNMVRHFGMIAGGTGITPMLQIIRAIVRGRPRNGGSDRTKVDLIFANVNMEDILLKDDLDKLNAEDEDFKVHYVLNNPPEKWDGGTGFVTADMIKAWTLTGILSEHSN